MKTNLPIREVSIGDIYNGENATYEIPIYQRNYAWEKDEITALVQDVYDAFKKTNNGVYYVGTLVTFHKGDQVYEVIDGQQRLTTIRIVLAALEMLCKNKLTYRARKKADETIRRIPNFDNDEKDVGIVRGYSFVKAALGEIVPPSELEDFKRYFQKSVHIIHYQVPKDIDLNHYFEIMNSRGEQLEKHEIIKARLLGKLNTDKAKAKFNKLWECCSEMNVYIQQRYQDSQEDRDALFGGALDQFPLTDFDSLPDFDLLSGEDASIKDLIDSTNSNSIVVPNRHDTFQPIIDFSNFLLVVLKITRVKVGGFEPKDFNLDDKDLLVEFDKFEVNEDFVKRFGYNLLKAKFLLDNYIVHHACEDDVMESNPWKLQRWQKDHARHTYLKNLADEADIQDSLVHLLSMFEVSFTARQRKNYLFYCLLFLFKCNLKDVAAYRDFLENLADKYISDVYFVRLRLNNINTPLPGSFDEAILRDGELCLERENKTFAFDQIYGDGDSAASHGVPLFLFNYLDYKIWKKYLVELRGEKTKAGDSDRKKFFEELGCGDLDLNLFNQFYFSRTRRSLEHYYPQANATGIGGCLNSIQINCFGNYAMIGSEANSSGSNWSPKTKLDHYLDSSGKVKQISVASLKFAIMMRKCKENQSLTSRNAGDEWNFDDIKDHQSKMIDLMLNELKDYASGVSN